MHCVLSEQPSYTAPVHLRCCIARRRIVLNRCVDLMQAVSARTRVDSCLPCHSYTPPEDRSRVRRNEMRMSFASCTSGASRLLDRRIDMLSDTNARVNNAVTAQSSRCTHS